jgi:DNA repair protein RecO (recombination protein O)
MQLVQGTVVRLAKLRDADKIIDLLSPQQGCVSFLARGARASKRRFRGTLDAFMELTVRCGARGELWTLEGVEACAPRLGIRASWQAMEMAAALCHLARRLAPAGSDSGPIHAALAPALDALDRGRLAAAGDGFVALVNAAGWLPDLACSRCGRRVGLALQRESPARCGDCGGNPQVGDWLVEGCRGPEDAQAAMVWAQAWVSA